MTRWIDWESAPAALNGGPALKSGSRHGSSVDQGTARAAAAQSDQPAQLRPACEALTRPPKATCASSSSMAATAATRWRSGGDASAPIASRSERASIAKPPIRFAIDIAGTRAPLLQRPSTARNNARASSAMATPPWARRRGRSLKHTMISTTMISNARTAITRCASRATTVAVISSLLAPPAAVSTPRSP